MSGATPLRHPLGQFYALYLVQPHLCYPTLNQKQNFLLFPSREKPSSRLFREESMRLEGTAEIPTTEIACLT